MTRKFLLNPVAILYVVNALVAMVVTWNWAHLTSAQTGAIDTIVTGILTIISAFLVTPVLIPVVSSAAITVLTAFAAFGLHLDNAKISSIVAVGSIALAYWTRESVVPMVAARLGQTAQQLQVAEVAARAGNRPAARLIP